MCKQEIKSHNKLNSISPIPAIMSPSPKSCTDKELSKSPKFRNPNRKLNINWH